jgi:hypothetical protein
MVHNSVKHNARVIGCASPITEDLKLQAKYILVAREIR